MVSADTRKMRRAEAHSYSMRAGQLEFWLVVVSIGIQRPLILLSQTTNETVMAGVVVLLKLVENSTNNIRENNNGNWFNFERCEEERKREGERQPCSCSHLQKSQLLQKRWH